MTTGSNNNDHHLENAIDVILAKNEHRNELPAIEILQEFNPKEHSTDNLISQLREAQEVAINNVLSAPADNRQIQIETASITSGILNQVRDVVNQFNSKAESTQEIGLDSIKRISSEIEKAIDNVISSPNNTKEFDVDKIQIGGDIVMDNLRLRDDKDMHAALYSALSDALISEDPSIVKGSQVAVEALEPLIPDQSSESTNDLKERIVSQIMDARPLMESHQDVTALSEIAKKIEEFKGNDLNPIKDFLTSSMIYHALEENLSNGKPYTGASTLAALTVIDNVEKNQSVSFNIKTSTLTDQNILDTAVSMLEKQTEQLPFQARNDLINDFAKTVLSTDADMDMHLN